MDLAFGGWQVTGIHVLQSGLALTATLGGANVVNLGGERRARPNLVGDPELPESERTLARWFNTDAFAAFAVPQAFGNAGVGIMRGPGSRQLRLHVRQELPGHGPALLPVPDRSVQRVQPPELRSAQHRQGLERVRPDSLGRACANHPVRFEVLFLSVAARPKMTVHRRHRQELLHRMARRSGAPDSPVKTLFGAAVAVNLPARQRSPRASRQIGSASHARS